MIGKYLEYIQEQREMGKGGIKRKPSPTFAYELIYGKSVPGGWRSGQCPLPHKSKMWNGISVDEHLEKEWLNKLNNIKNLEMRGSCEGHSKDWVSYIAFRLAPKFDKNKSFLNKVCSRLNKYPYTKCGWDIGTEERPRFVCATPLYYNCDKQEEWIKWWKQLPTNLNKAINS